MPLVLLFLSYFSLFGIRSTPTEGENSLVHPYHVGSLELRYNTKERAFEVTGKFFLDDMEQALSKRAGKALRFHDSSSRGLMEKTMELYLREHFAVKADGKRISFTYLGFEEESEAVLVYLESEPLKAPKKVEVALSVLYTIFEDQLNIVHTVVGSTRQSHQLRYPDRYFYRTF